MTISKLDDEKLAAFAKYINENIKPGMDVTRFHISDFMAYTQKDEIVMRSVLPIPEFDPHYQAATHGKYTIGTARYPGKRKDFYVSVDKTTLLFSGHGLGIKNDHDISNSFVGNACLNLWAPTIDELKEWIEKRNLNPLWDARDAVIYVTPPKEEYGMNEEVLVWPDVPTGHGVIDRMREKAGAA